MPRDPLVMLAVEAYSIELLITGGLNFRGVFLQSSQRSPVCYLSVYKMPIHLQAWNLKLFFAVTHPCLELYSEVKWWYIGHVSAAQVAT